MSTLQEQVVRKINGLSEDNLQFLLEMIDRFMQPETSEKENIAAEDGAMPFTMHLSSDSAKRTLGIANGKYKIPDNIDESNEQLDKQKALNQLLLHLQEAENSVITEGTISAEELEKELGV